MTSLISISATMLIYKKLVQYPHRQLLAMAIGFTLITAMIVGLLLSQYLFLLSKNIFLSETIHRFAFALGIIGAYFWFVNLSTKKIVTKIPFKLYFIFTSGIFLFKVIVNLLTIKYVSETDILTINYNILGLIPLTYVSITLTLLLEKQIISIDALRRQNAEIDMQPFNPKYWLTKFRAFFTVTGIFFFVARTFPWTGIPIFLWAFPFSLGVLYFAYAVFKLPIPVMQQLVLSQE